MTGRIAETHGPDFELLRHFIRRFFDSETVTTPGQWTSATIGALSLTLPAFLMIAPSLLHKYRYFSQLASPEPYRNAVRADELWLITLSMSLIGMLAAVKWQELFPGRLDYLVLGTLPVKTRQIFMAKLLALLLMACGAIIVIDALPALTFPAVSASRWQVNPSIPVHIAVHGVCCFLASLFFLFGVMACQGLLSNLLPRRWLAQVSSYAQGLLTAGMLILTVLSFSVGPPEEVAAMRPNIAPWLPPVWFLGLYQRMLGDSDPRFKPLASEATAGLAAAALIALLTCFLSYYRHRRLLMEGAPAAGKDGKLAALLLDFMVPDPRQQGVLAFMIKTLTRSGQHRLLLTGYVGIAVAVILSGLAGIRAMMKPDRAATASFVFAHTMLLIFVLIGLRHIFAVPAEWRANWTFQITEREGRYEWFVALDRFVLWAAAIPVLIFPLPFEAALLGWRSVTECALLAALLFLVYEFLFMEWEKLPFTCSYLPGKRSPMNIFVAFVAMAAYVPLLILILTAALYNAIAFGVILGAIFIAWRQARRSREILWGQLRLMYDDTPEPAVRSLNLGTN